MQHHCKLQTLKDWTVLINCKHAWSYQMLTACCGLLSLYGSCSLQRWRRSQAEKCLAIRIQATNPSLSQPSKSGKYEDITKRRSSNAKLTVHECVQQPWHQNKIFKQLGRLHMKYTAEISNILNVVNIVRHAHTHTHTHAPYAHTYAHTRIQQFGR